MQKKCGLDLVLLLLLFGIYFILKFISEKQVTDLIYGCILIIYHIKLKMLEKHMCK